MTANDLVEFQQLDLDHDGVSHRSMSATVLLAMGLPAAVVLGAIQERLCATVDSVAEDLRGKVATPGAGQAMEYQQAQVEAFDVLALSGAPVAGAYPMLEASVGRDIDPSTGERATDVLGAARSVKAAFGAWLAYGAAIRAARLAGKDAIRAAASIEEAAAAFSAIAWPAA